MQQARLDAQVRNKSGKGVARSLRRDGKVPAVLYGREKGTLSLQIDDRTFKTLLRNYGSNVLINLDLPGNDPETVIIKSLQRHPVKRNVLHADFQRISLEEKITTSVAIKAVGTPIGVRDGGVLTLSRRQITIICLPLDTPNSLQINVEGLNIGDSFRVSDLEFDNEKLEILESSITQIASVIEPKIVLETIVAEDEIEDEIEGEEGVEGEETSEDTEDTEEASE